MRYTFAFLIAFLLGTLSLGAEPSFPLSHPRMLARGGGLATAAGGYEALFANPAVFAQQGASINYSSVSAWMHSNFNGLPDVIGGLMPMDPVNSPRRSGLLADTMQTAGIGYGAAYNIGYVGNNFGIGASMGTDLFFQGRSYPDDIDTSMLTELQLTGGLGYPFMVGPLKISLGFALQPILRVHSMFAGDATAGALRDFLGFETAPGDYLNAPLSTFYGGGVAIHAGLQVEIGELLFGFVARNIGNTSLAYSRTSLQNIIDSLDSSVGLPPQVGSNDDGHVPPDTVSIPMDVRFGVTWYPVIQNSMLLEPMLYAEIGHFDLLTSRVGIVSPFQLINLGGGITINDWLVLGAGLAQGQLSLGASFDLGIFEINTAWFGRVIVFDDRLVDTGGIIIEFALRQ